MGRKKHIKQLSFLSLLSVAALSQLSVDDGSLSLTIKTVEAEDTLVTNTTPVTAPEIATVPETNKPVETTVTSTVLDTPKATFTVASSVIEQPKPTLAAPVVLAALDEEPPADEDVPDLNEQNLINQVNQQLEDIQLFLDEGDVDYAKQLFDEAAADFAAVNNIVNMKASKATLLEKIEKYRALVNGGNATPVTVTKTEAIAVTTVYEADPSLAYGQQTTQTGTAGEQSYTETNGVRDAGSEKIITAMVPTVVKVGTMPKEEVVAIPAPTTVVYEDDPTLEIGQTKLKTAAVAGSKTVVTSYQLKDATSAEVITTTSEKDIVAGQEAVYLRGTKQPDVVTVVSEEIVTEAIDYSSIVVENPNLEKGKENQLQAGKPGVMKRVYTVITVNGVEISRELISEEVIEEASSEIIEVGTMEKPTPSNTPKDTLLSNQPQLDTPKQKQEGKQTMGKGELPQTGDSQGLLEMLGLMILGMLATVTRFFKNRF